MEFKIDAKPTYTVIMPHSATIDAKMSDALAKKCEELLQDGSQNFLIDFQNAITADTEAFEILAGFAADCYENRHSFVITGLTPEINRQLKGLGSIELLNITPTIAEAVDIISMDILERDLLDEED